MKYADMNLFENGATQKTIFQHNLCIEVYGNIYQMTGEIFKGDPYTGV